MWPKGGLDALICKLKHISMCPSSFDSQFKQPTDSFGSQEQKRQNTEEADGYRNTAFPFH